MLMDGNRETHSWIWSALLTCMQRVPSIDIIEKGMVLTGGGAWLKDFAKILSEECMFR